MGVRQSRSKSPTKNKDSKQSRSKPIAKKTLQTLPGNMGVALWGRIIGVYFPPRRMFRLANLSRQFHANAVPRALWKVTEWVFARPAAYLSNLVTAAEKWGINASKLASKLPYLTKIEFYHAAKFVTNEIVDTFARACPRIRWIGLDCCKSVTDASVNSLTKHCPDLNFISHVDAGTTLESVYTIAKYMAENITLGQLAQMVTDLGHSVVQESSNKTLPLQLILDLASMAPHTTYADLDFLLPIAMDTEDVSTLARALPKLEAIHYNCDYEAWKVNPDTWLHALAEATPGLTTLHLENTPVSDAGLLAVAKRCPNLKDVVLCDTYVGLDQPRRSTSAGLATAFSTLTGLKHLRLKLNLAADNALAVAIAANCPLLEDFDFSLTRITDVGIIAIGKACKNLNSFCLNQFGVSDEGMCALATHGKLRMFSLTGCKDVSDVGLIALANGNPRLECVTVQWDRGTEGRSLVTDEGIAAFAACPDLEQMEIHGLDSVGDAAVEPILRHCPRLTWLGVSLNPKITPAITEAIISHDCSQLMAVDLSLTSVTSGQALSLVERMPSLVVYYREKHVKKLDQNDIYTYNGYDRKVVIPNGNKALFVPNSPRGPRCPLCMFTRRKGHISKCSRVDPLFPRERCMVKE